MTMNARSSDAALTAASFKTQRHYTVGYVPKFGDASTPALNISGKWLRELGFETGTKVRAEISKGCIVLQVETPESEENLSRAR
ncbi:SymE family type I addiction module toxin [Pantoea stewartii]|uniref:SymE family type I addiction module toxin n=1 Tax=Pantoea stewartii TaxID=66269 RepID=UPI002DBDB5CD|nr:SymE family type I addiction module toxin [Pantoea stewartii]MEB6533532.1 SymE family type I addiction module toxin [Pantoea stewartii]